MLDLYRNGVLGCFGGIRVFEDHTMIDQFRRPRSKRKRIQNKWKKNPRNHRPARHIRQNRATGDVYCHPAIAQELRRQIKSRAY